MSLVVEEEDYDTLTAALHGYQLRKYLLQQDTQLTKYRSASKLDFSSSLL